MNKGKKKTVIRKLYLLTNVGFNQLMKMNNDKSNLINNDKMTFKELMEKKNQINERLIKLISTPINERTNIVDKLDKISDKKDIAIQKDFLNNSYDNQDELNPIANSSFFEFEKSDSHDNVFENNEQKDVKNSKMENEHFYPKHLYDNIPLNTTEQKIIDENTSFDSSKEQNEFLQNLKEQGLTDVRELEFAGFDNSKEFVNARKKGNLSTYLVDKPQKSVKKHNVVTRLKRKKLRESLSNKKYVDYKTGWKIYEDMRRLK